MSVVIVGGNDCMVCRYKNICKKYSYKVKIFTQVPGDFKSKIGSPDLLVLFTSTVSHSMVHCAVKEAQRKNVEIVRSHTSSSNALKGILEPRAVRKDVAGNDGMKSCGDKGEAER
jgi:hypothetical protein